MAHPAPDALDLRILRELFAGDGYEWRTSKARTAGLAGKLGVHRNTVVNRVRRLEARGLFLPVVLDVAPPALGLASARLFFRQAARMTRAEDREAVLLVEGAKVLHRYTHGWGLVLCAEDDATLAQRVALLERIAGARAARPDFVEPAVPAARADLTPRQLATLAAVAGTPARGLGGAARRAGASPGAFRKTVQALAAQGFVTAYPGGDAEAGAGLFGYVGLTLPGQAADRERVLAEAEQVLDTYLLRHIAGGRLHVFTCWVSPQARAAQEGALRRTFPAQGLEVRHMVSRHLSPHYHPWLRRVLGRLAGS